MGPGLTRPDEDMARRIVALERQVQNLLNRKPNQRKIQARRTTNQTLTTAVWSAVSFNAIDTDTDGSYLAGSPDRFTFKTAGFWVMGCQAVFAGNNVGVRLVGINYNSTSLGAINSQIARVDPNSHTPAYANHVALAIGKQMIVGDYVIPCVYQDSGGNLDLTSDTVPVGFTFWAFRYSG